MVATMSDDTNKKQKEETVEDVIEKTEDSSKELQDFENELRDLDGKYKRALADYQNLEKRVREERTQWIKTANRDLLLRMLSIVDTLLLAKQHSDDKTLHIATAQFLDVLKSEGVTRIETEGKKFDPKLMECITVVEGKDGDVVAQLRPGFMLHDTVLRPAHVSVGKKN